MNKKPEFPWLPEELRQDLITLRHELVAGEPPRYSKSIGASKYCIPLLEDNFVVKNIWKEVLDVGVSPLGVYWACERPFEQAEKYRTKKMAPASMSELESDIRKTATKLRRLVKGTPVDDALRLSGWRTDEFEGLDMHFSDLLEIIATSNFPDYKDSEEYTRPLKKPGAKKAIRSEIILSLNSVFATVSRNRRNRLIADIASVVIGDATSEETVKEIVKNQK